MAAPPVKGETAQTRADELYCEPFVRRHLNEQFGYNITDVWHPGKYTVKKNRADWYFKDKNDKIVAMVEHRRRSANCRSFPRLEFDSVKIDHMKAQAFRLEVPLHLAIHYNDGIYMWYNLHTMDLGETKWQERSEGEKRGEDDSGFVYHECFLTINATRI